MIVYENTSWEMRKYEMIPKMGLLFRGRELSGKILPKIGKITRSWENEKKMEFRTSHLMGSEHHAPITLRINRTMGNVVLGHD